MELQKEIGPEVDLELKVEEGKVIVAVKYGGSGAEGKVEVALKAEYFLDKLAAAIPGQLDDAVIAAIKAAIK